MNVIEAFEQHLAALGYRPSTVAAYGEALVALHAHGGDATTIQAMWAAAVRRFLEWPEHTQAPDLTRAADVYLARVAASKAQTRSRVGPRRAAQAKRKRIAHSIGDDAFARLADTTWAEDSVAASALSVMYATGLRVGDIVAVTRRALSEGRAHGNIRTTVKGGDERVLPWAGAPEEWERLLGAFNGQPGALSTVADLLTGKPNASTLPHSAAHKRLDRALKRLALSVGINDRVHLHRLRRTVAVRVLRDTNDITIAQQMLGHRNIATTARYVDEARPEALAGIQRNVNPRKRN